MGVCLSWAVIKGCGKDPVQDLLGLRGTGTLSEVPDSDLNGATLPDGSYVIVSARDRLQLATQDVAARQLSGLGETIVCFVEEHTMCSYAASWRGGRRLWCIFHEAGRGDVMHLESEGQLPACFAEVYKDLRSQQQLQSKAKYGVDYIFEIPVEVACREGGYRYNEDLPGPVANAFEELVKGSEADTRETGAGPLGVTDFRGADFAGKPPSWWSWRRWLLRP
jgi:hypothetical protein